jgi:hypothetical protein
MALPWVGDGGDGLHIWRIAANTLRKQSQTADKGWIPGMEVGQGAYNSSLLKKPAYYKMLHRALDLDGFFGIT